MKDRHSFSKLEHIRKPLEFSAVFRQGKSYSNERFVVYLLDRKDSGAPRIGWLISAKVGKANKRFRIKRLIREVFRLNKGLIKQGYDTVVIPAKKAVEIKNYEEMKKDLLGLLSRGALK